MGDNLVNRFDLPAAMTFADRYRIWFKEIADAVQKNPSLGAALFDAMIVKLESEFDQAVKVEVQRRLSRST